MIKIWQAKKNTRQHLPYASNGLRRSNYFKWRYPEQVTSCVFGFCQHIEVGPILFYGQIELGERIELARFEVDWDISRTSVDALRLKLKPSNMIYP